MDAKSPGFAWISLTLVLRCEPVVEWCSMLVHLPLSSEWGTGLDNGEIKAVMKGTHHPSLQSRWPRTSALSSRHLPK